MPARKFLWVALGASLCLASNSFAQINPQQLQTLDANSLKALVAHSQVLGTQFDLLTLHNNLSYLDNKATMEYFIMLNNCNNSGQTINQIQKAFNSEFDFPSMAAFYKAKAADILSSVPVTFTVAMNTYPNPANPQTAFPINLGEYDQTTGTFPFVTVQNQKTSITLSNAAGIGPREGLNSFCGAAYAQTGGAFLGGQMPAYYVFYPKMTFSGVKVDEATARRYVSSLGVGAAGVGRAVSFWIDIEVLPNPPQIAPMQHVANAASVSYQGKLTKVQVRDNQNHLLGILYP